MYLNCRLHRTELHAHRLCNQIRHQCSCQIQKLSPEFQIITSDKSQNPTGICNLRNYKNLNSYEPCHTIFSKSWFHVLNYHPLALLYSFLSSNDFLIKSRKNLPMTPLSHMEVISLMYQFNQTGKISEPLIRNISFLKHCAHFKFGFFGCSTYVQKT